MGHEKQPYMIDELKIESGVPIPKVKKRRNWPTLLDKLAIGQSIAFPKEEKSSVNNTMHRCFHKVNLKRFTINDDPEDGTGTLLRIWRMADAIK